MAGNFSFLVKTDYLISATRKGFTLIELLIVVGVIAVLATVVLLIINPAQLLAETRDASRLNDFKTIMKAVDLTTYRALPLILVYDPGPWCSITTTVANPFQAGGNCGANTDRTVDGSGWMGVDLTAGGAISQQNLLLAILPIDPLNNSTYFYAYKGDNGNKIFELNTRLESLKYRDLMKTDGGNRNTCSTYVDVTCFYEMGTALSL